MKLFPSVSEWHRLYNRMLIYTAVSASTLLLFWIQRFDSTGVRETGTNGLPRFWDGPAMIVWVLLLVVGARFAQFVHERTMPSLSLSIELFCFFRKFSVYSLICWVVVSGVGDALRGGDVVASVRNAALLLSVSLLLYWWLAVPLAVMRWHDKRCGCI